MPPKKGTKKAAATKSKSPFRLFLVTLNIPILISSSLLATAAKTTAAKTAAAKTAAAAAPATAEVKAPAAEAPAATTAPVADAPAPVEAKPVAQPHFQAFLAKRVATILCLVQVAFLHQEDLTFESVAVSAQSSTVRLRHASIAETLSTQEPQ